MKDISVISEYTGSIVEVVENESYFIARLICKFEECEAYDAYIPFDVVNKEDLLKIKKDAVVDIIMGYASSDPEKQTPLISINLIEHQNIEETSTAPQLLN